MQGKNFGEVVELVGGGGKAVGLERVQDGFVVDDPKISCGDVSVVVIDFDASQVRFIGLGRVNEAEGFGGLAEIGAFTFIAESAFVVEAVAEAEIGADLAKDFLFERKHIARDVGGVDFTRGASLSSFGSEVGGGLEGGIPPGGVTGDTNTGFIDVIKIVGVGKVVDDGKHSVAFLGSGAGAEGGAGGTLGIGVDGDDDDAAASEFE